MMTLILGGAASGKSCYAESLVLRLQGERIYIATMQPCDAESRTRIAKHRQLRAHKRFATLECATALEGAAVPNGANVLLECMSNLVANELYDPLGAGDTAVQAVLQGVEQLLCVCANLTIVTNEVFSGGADYTGDTQHYLWQLAAVNRALAQRADVVVEVVAGLANVLKGGEMLP